jgi:benzil reductase ((S)-benzoin forming)
MPPSPTLSKAPSGRAIVLSGPTRGLGKALFERLLSKGDQLVLVGRGVGELLAAHEDALTPPIVVEADLGTMADPCSGGRLSRAIGDALGAIAFERLVFINNAGAIYPVAPIGHLSADAVAVSASVNFGSIVILADACCRAASTKAASYTVLNISSGAANRVIASWSMYCATKAATQMFFNVLAEERSAKVHHIDPGVMNTDMQAEIRAVDRELFPAVGSFQALAVEGKLQPPDAVAERIVDTYLS